MTTRPLLLASLAAATILSGCGTANRGLESVHQPVVARSDFMFDVAASSAGVAPSERARLAGWMETIGVGYGDQVALDDPFNSGNRVRDDVAAVAARHGLLLTDAAPVTAAPVAPGTVRVIVSRGRAYVPGCPDRSRMNEPTWVPHTDSNYGCATNTNLAAMIANPADLVRGQPGSGTVDTSTNTRAIDTLRAAKPTGEGGTWLRDKIERGDSK